MTEGNFNKWRETRQKGPLRYVLKNTFALAVVVFVLDFLLSLNSEATRGFPNWDLILIVTVLNLIYFLFAWRRTEKKYKRALDKLDKKE